MEIIKNQLDDLNIEVTIALKGEDYAEQEKKRLAAYRRNADFKGFRKGMAPAQLVKKVYGDQALYESINGIVGEQLDKFIKDNNLNILGEPLGSESQKELEWEDGKDFEFKFDIGLSPEINLEVGADDKLPYYVITVTDDAKKEAKKSLLDQYGEMEEGDAAGADDLVIVDFRQGETLVEGAYVSVDKAEGEAKDKFLGAKSGDSFDINVNEAFTNETDRASMLKVSKEALADLDPMWNVTVINVKTFVPATESQETYDKIFGEGEVKSAEEFDARIAERIEADYRRQADYRLSSDICKHLVEKANVSLPENFLKRWLYEANKEKVSMEDVEKEFNGFLSDFRWQLVRGYLMKKFNLKVEDNDMLEAARGYVTYQYSMYGLPNIPEDFLRESALKVLQDERQMNNIRENVESEKVIAAVKEQIALQNKEISLEEFRELK